MEAADVMEPTGNRRKTIYLLPNLLTTGSLFAGFYSIISSLNQDFVSAAIAIFIALILDGLDGRVARLLNAQSAFGAQYDSLSDLLSFGIAPPLLAYNFNELFLNPLGFSKLAWLSAFIFLAAVALRLARFNVQLDSVHESRKAKRYFHGMPCPAGAALMASMIWVCSVHGYQNITYSIAVVSVMLVASFLMVSNIRFRSFKDIDPRINIRFTYMVLLVLILVGIWWRPAEMLFSVFALYLISGPIFALVRIRRKHDPHAKTHA
jgi:CDP-diacylglycerol--serine O-phosphatidyltransferase